MAASSEVKPTEGRGKGMCAPARRAAGCCLSLSDVVLLLRWEFGGMDFWWCVHRTSCKRRLELTNHHAQNVLLALRLQCSNKSYPVLFAKHHGLVDGQPAPPRIGCCKMRIFCLFEQNSWSFVLVVARGSDE